MTMKMFNPPHPGLIIREDVLPDLGLSVTEAANQLGVSRVTLSRVINGRAAISADMAIRFAQWLGGSAETWLGAQAQYDLWHTERGKRIKIKPAIRSEMAA
jgi:antitoxin HigA-1